VFINLKVLNGIFIQNQMSKLLQPIKFINMEKQITNFRMTRRNFMQLLSFILVAFFLMSFVENTSAQKPNFSGTWAFNQTKSDQPPAGGGNRGGGGGSLTIKQEANNLNVDRVFTTQDGEQRTMTSKYTLDGKESVNTMGGNRGGSSKSIATWSADNKSLNIATTSTFQSQDGQARESKNSAVWTLTDGGKTLTITTTGTSRDGETRVNKRVYDKK
jgi:hypothetical protein